MKKYFLSVVFFLSAYVLNAQTIHWLTFVDTKDSSVGLIDKTGRSVLYNRFVNIINSALTPRGYKTDIHDIYDYEFSPERCKEEVSELVCDDDDIVVFYYIGHGTHSPEDKNPYPQMLLGQKDERKFIPLKWVHEELKNKGPRLVLTVGMCCNAIQNVSAKQVPMFAVNYGNVELTDNELKSIQKMFLGYRGDFIISSASVNQSSISSSTPFGDMDLFTAVLVTAFEDLSYDGTLDWNSLFGQVRDVVNNVTGSCQTPFWDYNLTDSSIPMKRNSAPTTTKTLVDKKVEIQDSDSELGISDVSGMCNYLTSLFDYMIDNSNSWSLRKNEMKKVLPLFTNDAVVKILPQDFDTPVIDKENISVFLGRISSSDGRIIKVIPVSYRYNDNKITELRVRECYTK